MPPTGPPPPKPGSRRAGAAGARQGVWPTARGGRDETSLYIVPGWRPLEFLCRPALLSAIREILTEADMSSPAAGNPHRIGHTPARSGNSGRQSQAHARRNRLAEIAIPTSVLMLMMLGGLALRALLSIAQGI